MARGIPDRLLLDRITLRRPVQSLLPGSRRPVFRYEVVAVQVPARFVATNTALNRGVLGQKAKKIFRLFLNPRELLENWEVVNEATGEVFVVTEAKAPAAHHIEAILQEKAT
ncbi:MAG: hypothetical protein HY548_06415 [Elusimicrobia bacterium]|nr:hypothetical protein [Elusimicrobiota bacterium]